ncbi:zinc-binding dehydrogenase [Actinophytocola gossypii]|uniref:zinc-binding dehydrogenase n=1 Tax=Actinophytocola gossypii TaxID=2812003 RepID=UPI0028831B96|nr:zinc-binding dehydrogenase [Actinophytocola gossypii]
MLRFDPELPDPEPGTGQVRIAVEYAAITFIDTQRRAGRAPGPAATFPAVLGNGVGGFVERLGPGTDPSWAGARVVSTTGGAGGYASLALADIADLHRVPEPLDLADATALLADGRTALALHDAARVRAEETVVITAAAGGVGGILVQLATSAGAVVIALASPDKLDRARGHGAPIAIDYREPGWPTDLRAAAPHGVDVVFDGVGASTTDALFPLVRAGGRYLAHGAASGTWGAIEPDRATARGVGVIPLAAIGGGPDDMFAYTERALDLAAHGTIHATIGQTFPLGQAAEAHAAIEARTTIGKTLLLPNA